MEKYSGKNKVKRYESISLLRIVSCFGIVLMHIQSNTNYNIVGNYIWDTIIPSWTWFVFLFLIISGFGMSAGYLEKFHTNNINLNDFYKKRYMKIGPFFSIIIFIDLMVNFSLASIQEASISLTMLHGFLPNNKLSVVGVGWTIGVVFVFYLLFPAFSVLMKSKKMAWLSFIISLWINYICESYFFTSYYVTDSFTARHSFLYCMPLFIVGGIIYLYRNEITKLYTRFKVLMFSICIIVTFGYYIVPQKIMDVKISFIINLILFSSWMILAICIQDKFTNKRAIKFLSDISIEIYLAHMVVFRVLERLNLIYILGDSGLRGWGSYLLTFSLIILLLIILICIYRFLLKQISNILKNKYN